MISNWTLLRRQVDWHYRSGRWVDYVMLYPETGAEQQNQFVSSFDMKGTLRADSCC